MLQNSRWDKVKVQPELDEVGKCFLYAAQLLEFHGWCQGTILNIDGRMCISGAIQSYPTGLLNNNRCIETQTEALEILNENLGDYISVWNDHPQRTKEQVIAK